MSVHGGNWKRPKQLNNFVQYIPLHCSDVSRGTTAHTIQMHVLFPCYVNIICPCSLILCHVILRPPSSSTTFRNTAQWFGVGEDCETKQQVWHRKSLRHCSQRYGKLKAQYREPETATSIDQGLDSPATSKLPKVFYFHRDMWSLCTWTYTQVTYSCCSWNILISWSYCMNRLKYPAMEISSTDSTKKEDETQQTDHWGFLYLHSFTTNNK